MKTTMTNQMCLNCSFRHIQSNIEETNYVSIVIKRIEYKGSGNERGANRKGNVLANVDMRSPTESRSEINSYSNIWKGFLSGVQL